MNLTILVVSDGRPHAARFVSDALDLADELGCRFVLACDGRDGQRLGRRLGCARIHVESAGYLESVLDEAVQHCADGWIFRLDDDECCTPELVAWLADGEWEAVDHWAFPRRNLYPDAHSWITSHGLYPDYQTRLSIKEKSGGRVRVHVGSPHGTGQIAPAAIDHHKFLARSVEERAALVERYERLEPGAGSGFVQFSVPELVDGLMIQSAVAA